MTCKWGVMNGRYCVVIDVWQASDGWYSPQYEIFDGNPSDGAKSVKLESFPAGPEFPNRVVASRFVSEIAASWIAKRLGAKH